MTPTPTALDEAALDASCVAANAAEPQYHNEDIGRETIRAAITAYLAALAPTPMVLDEAALDEVWKLHGEMLRKEHFEMALHNYFHRTALAPTAAEQAEIETINRLAIEKWRQGNREPAQPDRIAALEAQVKELERERDEALCLAEGPSTLIDLARGGVERGAQLQAAEQKIVVLEEDVVRLTGQVRFYEERAAPEVPHWDITAPTRAGVEVSHEYYAALETVAVALREAVIALEATHHPHGPSDEEVNRWRKVLDRYDALARLGPGEVKP